MNRDTGAWQSCLTPLSFSSDYLPSLQTLTDRFTMLNCLVSNQDIEDVVTGHLHLTTPSSDTTLVSSSAPAPPPPAPRAPRIPCTLADSISTDPMPDQLITYPCSHHSDYLVVDAPYDPQKNKTIPYPSKHTSESNWSDLSADMSEARVQWTNLERAKAAECTYPATHEALAKEVSLSLCFQCKSRVV